MNVVAFETLLTLNPNPKARANAHASSPLKDVSLELCKCDALPPYEGNVAASVKTVMKHRLFADLTYLRLS